MAIFSNKARFVRFTNMPAVLLLAFFAIWCKHVQAINMTGCIHHEPYPYIFDGAKQPEGDIYSPGFHDDGYPDYSYCDYIIKVPEDHIIKLTFKEMSIEPATFCTKDKVYVIDGVEEYGKDLGAYCGLEPPSYPMLSTNNAMRLSFRSNDMIRNKGFHAHYQTVLKTEICPAGHSICKNKSCFKDSQRCDGMDNCGDGTDEECCPFKVDFSIRKCGPQSKQPVIHSKQRHVRIVGGEEAELGNYPWQADIQVSNFYPNGHHCGGTLINPQWVMTSAHCVIGVTDIDNWRVHLGNHQKYLKDPHEQIRMVVRIIIYPEFTGKQVNNKRQNLSVQIIHDVALMRLNAAVKITDHVKPACLPPKGYEVPFGTKCMATGWGVTRGSGNDDVLKQAEMFVQSGEICPSLEKEKTMCLRSKNGLADICDGDAGGPLSCQINDKWTVAGIARYGRTSNMISLLPCGVTRSGTIFTKVSSITSWIDFMMQKYS